MLSGVKFISRDKVDDETDDSDARLKCKKKSGSKNDKHRSRKKKISADSSSDDEYLRRKKEDRRKKKWYLSDECSSSYSTESESGESSGQDGKKRKKSKRSNKSGFKKDGNKGRNSQSDKEIVRKEMGLEWMLQPGEKIEKDPILPIENPQEEASIEEVKKLNPRELNPYLKDNGSGYPDDIRADKAGGDKLPSSSVVGDGGASWRLKALKRAQEQAAREGRRLEEVVEERWDSLGDLTVSVASRRAAPSRAHLHAINSRKKGLTEDIQTDLDRQSERDKKSGRDYLKDVSVRHPKMMEPKVLDSLSWRKRKGQNVPMKDPAFISAVSNINKFENTGNFMNEFASQHKTDSGTPVKGGMELNLALSETKEPIEDSIVIKDTMSANQLAAKAFQLQMKGKHDEAQKLLQEVDKMKATSGSGVAHSKPRNEETTSRHVLWDVTTKRKEDDGDMNLASKIMQNKQYSMSKRADDEYDFEDGPSKKSGKKRASDNQKSTKTNTLARRILTQVERCNLCFENPNRPKHLVVSIANFTYLMLPQWQPVVPGHCCILPMQHESATRTVDKNVWEEIRNFKKCLIMMFSGQEKDLIFLETVMGLAQQRRHCLLECIPLPREIAKEAPLYFKKAIDEAEDEWSQHNAKKLIDTSTKGLRGSIPEHFPYFHVEFGLNKGFVHVIDDEKQFKSSLGLNVIRGMLRLPEEDMYRNRRYESVEVQKEAVARFSKDWAQFDWTKQL